MTKGRRRNIRYDEQTRALLVRGADHSRVTLSELARSRAVEAAEQVVQEHESITLQQAAFTAFLTALDTPAAEPSPALLKAAERHASRVDEG